MTDRADNSVIYQLYLDSLPWTTGGEYLRFYLVVRELVEAWRSVGLDPTFVFDGKWRSAVGSIADDRPVPA